MKEDITETIAITFSSVLKEEEATESQKALPLPAHDVHAHVGLRMGGEAATRSLRSHWTTGSRGGGVPAEGMAVAEQ